MEAKYSTTTGKYQSYFDVIVHLNRYSSTRHSNSYEIADDDMMNYKTLEDFGY